MSDVDLYELKGAKCIAETEKAILIEHTGGRAWTPQSVVHADSEVYAKGHEGKLVVHGWWARKAQLPGAE